MSWDSGIRIESLGFMVQGLEFRVQGLGFRGQGLGFRVQSLGFRVQRFLCLGFRDMVQCLGFGFQGLGFRVYNLGLRVQDLGFRVQGLGLRFKVQDLSLGFRVQGLGGTQGQQRSHGQSGQGGHAHCQLAPHHPSGNRVFGSVFRVLECRDLGLRYRIEGPGSRVQGLEFRA